MDEIEVWAAVDRNRSALARLMDDLPADQWRTPSLCDGWTVRDVAAHLTTRLLTWREFLALGLRHPGGVNTFIKQGAITVAKRYEIDELRRRLHRLDGDHRPFPGLTSRATLADAIAHSLDIAIPLGLHLDLPAAEVAEAADQIVAYQGRGKARVFKSVPFTGFRLVADDHPWSAGSGPEIRGDLTSLFLLVSGRTVWVDRLHGPGADQLRQLSP